MTDILALVFSGVSAVAAVASAIAAFKAKAEVKNLSQQIGDNQKRTVNNKGDVEVTNKGKNTGSVVGINAGDLNV